MYVNIDLFFWKGLKNKKGKKKLYIYTCWGNFFLKDLLKRHVYMQKKVKN